MTRENYSGAKSLRTASFEVEQVSMSSSLSK